MAEKRSEKRKLYTKEHLEEPNAKIQKSSPPRNSEAIANPNSSSSLKVKRDYLERKKFPNFQKPKELAIFSTKSNPSKDILRVTENASSSAKKYTLQNPYARTLNTSCTANRMNLVEPPNIQRVNFDLNSGYGKQIEKGKENEHLNILLESLVKENLVGRSEFVCWRGLLTKIGSTPYDVGGRFDHGLKVSIQKVGNVFYLCEFPTESALRAKSAEDERQKLMSYWGMKFESYLTAKPNRSPAPDEPMNFNDEFGSVVESKLGSHRLIFAGEVDCSLPNDEKRYVELKTTRECDHPGQQRSFRKFKLIKWWLQSFLIGIDDILCGFRSDAGVVHRCEWFKVSAISQIIKQDKDHCRPSVCFSFIDLFLDFVKEKVIEEWKPYLLSRQPGQSEFKMTIDECGDHAFMPAWFVEQVSNVDSKTERRDNL